MNERDNMLRKKYELQRMYASVWIRLAAIIIDGLLVIPFYLPIYIIMPILEKKGYSEDLPAIAGAIIGLCVIAGIIFAIWNTIYRMGKTGQSLGRKFLNIAVLDEYGKPIGFGRAFLREVIGRWISGLICYIGYLSAFWDKKRQMWHDKIASCYVYNVSDDYRGRL
jgi:uncharacterized RDD family membrane protein YckC